jgi:DNA-binding MarR family transcriptional regulator
MNRHATHFDRLRHLIDEWEAYEQAHPEPEPAQTPEEFLQYFGAYLLTRHLKQEPLDPSITNWYVDYYMGAPLEVQAPILLIRVFKLLRHHIKRLVEHDEGLTIEELGFLFAIDHHQTARKSEVIHANLMETTTGSEILLRLQRRGLIQEMIDPDDRRARRVSLTQDGSHKLNRIRNRMMPINVYFMHTLPLPHKQALLQLLAQLNRYHSNRYFRGAAQSFDDLDESFRAEFGKSLHQVTATLLSGQSESPA